MILVSYIGSYEVSGCLSILDGAIIKCDEQLFD